MSSLDPKDRVSLCRFTFADGRRCRTPRAPANPHFCFYHAQKEARAAAAGLLATDLSYFFSGDYLSACDLSSALARIIPAVVQGHVKPRVARTVACLFQTLVQAVRLSQHEYINSFGTDGWRQAIFNGVNSNSDYRYPPDPGDDVPTVAPQPTPPPASPQTLVPTPPAAPSSPVAGLSPSPAPPPARPPAHSTTAPAPRPPQPSSVPVSARQPAPQMPSQTPPAQFSAVSPQPPPAPPAPQQPAPAPQPPASPGTPQIVMISEPFRRRRRLSWGSRQVL